MSIAETWWEHSNKINEDGVLLDDYGNELRDEDGAVIYVPEKDWVNCEMIRGMV